MNDYSKRFASFVLVSTLIGSAIGAVPQSVYASTSHEHELVNLAEVIKNGSLENNGSGWSRSGNGKFVTDGTPSDGEYCGLLPLNSGNASVYQKVTLKKNTDYVLKAKVLMTEVGQQVFVNVKNRNLDGFPQGIRPEVILTCKKGQEWTYQDVELKFNSKDNTNVSVAVMKWVEKDDRVTSNPSYAAQAYVDEVSLVEVEREASQYNMVWADDFNGNELDQSKWGYELGCVRGVEQQHYTNSEENVYVDQGKLNLQITDRKVEDQYKNPRGRGKVIYDSGSVRTHGKQEFLYGRIEMRAKLPKGKGVFPAFWTLGSDFTLDGDISSEQGAPWPVCGEVDIMELTGKSLDTTLFGNQTVWQTLHYGDAQDQDNGKYANKGKNYRLSSGVFNDDYHIFGLEWNKGKMEWYVDNQIVRTVDYSDDPLAMKTLDRPQYVQLNLAAGGNWPGDAGSHLAGQKFEIDYVYYAQNKQQQADAKAYYDQATKINGVKDVTIHKGEIPNLLEGITSTGDTVVDFSIDNEYTFNNSGGRTEVINVCGGQVESHKIAQLPVGKYNIYYTAMEKDPSKRMNPYTRKAAILTIIE